MNELSPEVYEKSTPGAIRSLFNSIAQDYDRANSLMSFGMHYVWNRRLVKSLGVDFRKPNTLLDLCAGTGEISYEYLKQAKAAGAACQSVHLLDFSEGMLEQAKVKSKAYCEHKLSFHVADAQVLPLPAACVDYATMAYGIRNVQDPKKAAFEVLRVLRPGGTWGILELTRPQNGVLRWGHNLYLQHVLPLIGRAAASNEEAYNYLARSIREFLQPQDVAAMLRSLGFASVTLKPVFGGVAHILLAKKESA